MINSETKAIAVQKRRAASGRYGIAKAVRRYINRVRIENLVEYKRIMNKLDVNRPEPPAETPEQAQTNLENSL